MSNAVVKVNGSQATLPTVLGQGLARIPTGGKIRAGIKVLTAKAAAHPDARAIYERGMAEGESFIQIEKALAAALPQLKAPLIPRTCPGSRCVARTFPIQRSPVRFWRSTGKTEMMALSASTGSRSCFRLTSGRW